MSLTQPKVPISGSSQRYTFSGSWANKIRLKSPNHFPAAFQCLLVHRLPFGPSPFESCRYLKSAPPQYLAQSPYRSVCLIEQNVERERSSAGAEQYRPLAFMQRTRNAARTLPHHAVYQTVEQHLQLTRHIAPITGRTYNQNITFLYQPQGLLGIIIRQNTSQTFAACHATCAWPYRQIRYVEQRNLHAAAFSFAFHGSKHP